MSDEKTDSGYDLPEDQEDEGNFCNAMEIYAEGNDIIAEIEYAMSDRDIEIDKLEKQRKEIDNAIRMDVETEWEVKKSAHLSNETKRRIKYEEIAKENKTLQNLTIQIQQLRLKNIRARIDLDNERRAFQFKLAMLNAGK